MGTRELIMRTWLAVIVFSLGGITNICGCGGEKPRDDFEQESPEIQYGKSAKMTLVGLRENLLSEGIPGLKSSLVGAVESFENYETEPVGELKDVYKQIFEGLKELQGSVGTLPRDQALVKINALIELSKKLPGDISASPAQPQSKT